MHVMPVTMPVNVRCTKPEYNSTARQHANPKGQVPSNVSDAEVNAAVFSEANDCE